VGERKRIYRYEDRRTRVEHHLGLDHPQGRGGSSRWTTLEFHITGLLATATDWRCPPESEATGWRMERTVVTRRLLSVSAAPAPWNPRRATPGGAAPSQEHVLDDSRGCRQSEILIDGLDARLARVAGGADVHRASPRRRSPVVDLVDARRCKRVEHRLARRRCHRTKPVTWPAGKIQVHLVERLDRNRSACRCPAASTAAPMTPSPRHSPRLRVVIHLSRLQINESRWQLT